MGVDDFVLSDEDLMNMLKDINREVDVKTLSYDSPRRAAERMKEDYANGLECDYEDVITVLGEPNTEIVLPRTQEETERYFLKRMDESSERNVFLDITREDRIRARKEKYKAARAPFFD